MNIKKFLQMLIVVLVLWGINAAGVLFFHWKMKSGALKQMSADNHETWTFQEHIVPPVKKNDIGLREELNIAELKKEPRPKVVLIGNSVVYGAWMGTEPTFSHVLQEQIPNYKVINMGIDGFEIWREFPFYDQHLAATEPELVIWFASGNDFVMPVEMTAKVEESKKQNDWIELSAKTFLTPTFYRLLAQKFYVEYAIIAENFLSSPHNQHYTNGILQPFPNEVMNTVGNRVIEFKNSLGPKTKFMVVFLPSRIYAKLYNWEQAVSYQQLGAILNQAGISSVQLVDFVHEKCPIRCYVDYVHFNEQGHRLVGEELGRILKTFLPATGK